MGPCTCNLSDSIGDVTKDRFCLHDVEYGAGTYGDLQVTDKLLVLNLSRRGLISVLLGLSSGAIDVGGEDF